MLIILCDFVEFFVIIDENSVEIGGVVKPVYF